MAVAEERRDGSVDGRHGDASLQPATTPESGDYRSPTAHAAATHRGWNELAREKAEREEKPAAQRASAERGAWAIVQHVHADKARSPSRGVSVPTALHAAARDRARRCEHARLRARQQTTTGTPTAARAKPETVRSRRASPKIASTARGMRVRGVGGTAAPPPANPHEERRAETGTPAGKREAISARPHRCKMAGSAAGLRAKRRQAGAIVASSRGTESLAKTAEVSVAPDDAPAHECIYKQMLRESKYSSGAGSHSKIANDVDPKAPSSGSRSRKRRSRQCTKPKLPEPAPEISATAERATPHGVASSSAAAPEPTPMKNEPTPRKNEPTPRKHEPSPRKLEPSPRKPEPTTLRSPRRRDAGNKPTHTTTAVGSLLVDAVSLPLTAERVRLDLLCNAEMGSRPCRGKRVNAIEKPAKKKTRGTPNKHLSRKEPFASMPDAS
ncbi:PREDICTED: serine/arginine repetitive matrix protein 1-like [Priapulus caudatus]|uniref:Serine/arginine repetitive matrix protein 1-like n=1 Tax=Priapulus caudatus TaxID=37621 RepID=A0ABM1EER6_PRICU|nr:PREDICTED: serine/arginine repetitive matrix protein 1-like [Priapulus caudatus]